MNCFGGKAAKRWTDTMATTSFDRENLNEDVERMRVLWVNEMVGDAERRRGKLRSI